MSDQEAQQLDPQLQLANDLLQKGEALLQPWTTESSTPEPGRLDVWIEAANLPLAVQALQDGEWGYLSTLTGLDSGPEAGYMEALYHFCEGAAVLTIRVKLGREAPAVPSVCGIIPSASFFERELMEMLGVIVQDTPNTDHLFLPDDWPDGVYPLRKDFEMAQLKKAAD
ncbi:MAG: NADH-quinone oxidoreductase subunit C [Anaerolineae bacterium]|nr:NADH-quinone oxidoreductase subunit C [Anaerolineae bacterium]